MSTKPGPIQTNWTPSDALTGNPFRYTGRRVDPETGLYYYRARYYSPRTGRFLQTDPIGRDDELNLYVYSIGDPLNRVDPLGDDSFVVARPLSSAFGFANLGHAFVVTNARYLGDPDATIHSFGPIANGNLGNVSKSSAAAAAAIRTAADDWQAWLNLANRAPVANIARIAAPDRLVDTVAGLLKEDRPYSLLPNPSESAHVRGVGLVPTPEANSNSAAFAIGDAAQRQAKGDPTSRVDRSAFKLWLPGIGAADKLGAGGLHSCTGTRIQRESCP